MRRWLVAACPEALVAGTAEAIALADLSVDAVFSAEAFHWFAHDRALAEIGRVMRPDGTFDFVKPSGWMGRAAIIAVEHPFEPSWPKDIDMQLDLDPRSLPHACEWPPLSHSAFGP